MLKSTGRRELSVIRKARSKANESTFSNIETVSRFSCDAQIQKYEFSSVNQKRN